MIAPATLRGRSARELAAVLAAGRPFAPAQLAGWLYRGISLGLPRLVERVSWVKFAKAFVATPTGVRGWNLRVAQDALDAPCRPLRRAGQPIAFGHFDVVARAGAIELDYRAGGGALRAVRDPVVALDDRADVLIGRTLLAVGPLRLPTPSYFVLERDAPLTEPVARP